MWFYECCNFFLLPFNAVFSIANILIAMSCISLVGGKAPQRSRAWNSFSICPQRSGKFSRLKKTGFTVSVTYISSVTMNISKLNVSNINANDFFRQYCQYIPYFSKQLSMDIKEAQIKSFIQLEKKNGTHQTHENVFSNSFQTFK